MPNDWIDHDGGADVRDYEQKFQEPAEQDPVVLPGTEDVRNGVAENRLRNAAGIDVTNVIRKSTPKIRARC